jgi:hypothetical protein
MRRKMNLEINSLKGERVNERVFEVDINTINRGQ